VNSDERRILSTLASYCHLLVEVTFAPTDSLYWGYQDDEPTAQLAQNCPLLEVLQLNMSVDVDTITALGKHCHNLECLVVPLYEGALDDAIITAFAQGCPRLQVLSVGITPPVTMQGITALATHCPRLRQVRVDQKVLGGTHKCNQRVLPGRKLTIVK
jgi:hypothetical protein